MQKVQKINLKHYQEYCLQQLIKQNVYDINHQLFQDYDLFQMIVSKPYPNIQFKQYVNICRGSFKCKNQKCKSVWVSQRVNVIVFFISYPDQIGQFTKRHHKKKRCQIYYYVKIYGQRCRNCQFKTYSYPQLLNDQQQRVATNFRYFIENNVFHLSRSYQQSRYINLQGHQQQLCEACQLNICKGRGTGFENNQQSIDNIKMYRFKTFPRNHSIKNIKQQSQKDSLQHDYYHRSIQKNYKKNNEVGIIKKK